LAFNEDGLIGFPNCVIHAFSNAIGDRIERIHREATQVSPKEIANPLTRVVGESFNRIAPP